MHFGELLHLVRGQDFFQFGLGIGFQSGDLRLLVVRQVQALFGTRRQEVEAAARPARTMIGRRRLLAVRRGRSVLGGEEAGGGAEDQREEHYFRFHNMLLVFCLP
jgi:hypothetical protein